MENEAANIDLAIELKRQATKLQELAKLVEGLTDNINERHEQGNDSPPSVLKERPSSPYQNTFRTKIKQKGQVTIPSKVRDALDLEDGDTLIGVYDPISGEMRFIEDASVDPGKAWFWQDKWQEMMHQSMSDLVDGRVTRVDSLDDIADT